VSLDWLYATVTWIILRIHEGLSVIFHPDSGAAWVLSIVLLVVVLRILLFPLFMKQLNSSRKMQEIQPQVRELQKKYKNDQQKLRQEMMELYREKGANPLGGCLPLLVQAPIFFALFHVLRTIALDQPTDWGLTRPIVESASNASIFGATIADRFISGPEAIAHLTIGPGQIVALLLVITSTITTFFTMRYSMQRAMAQPGAAENPFVRQQKMLLYFIPLFGLFGLGFPVGVLIYWVSNNLWTLGQQHLVYRRYPATAGTPGEQTAKADAATSGANESKTGGLMARRNRSTSPPSPPPTQQVVRRQPVRRPRSKRSGGRKR
jgi:YidC/Oxa1 family membrane protein insertase